MHVKGCERSYVQNVSIQIVLKNNVQNGGGKVEQWQPSI